MRLCCPCGDYYQEISSKLVQDKFLRIAKVTQIDNFENGAKLCNVVFLKFNKKMFIIQKRKTSPAALKKTLGRMFLDFG